ncbi:TPA: DUF551 domain-containing protein [Klebsiella quasipneumoniae]
MTKSTITRERIQRIIRAINSEAYDEEEIREWLSSDEIMELSRMALAAMDGEPVALTANIERDAQRYRFLRERDAFGDDGEPGLASWDDLIELDTNEFDAAIDARMAHPSVDFLALDNALQKHERRRCKDRNCNKPIYGYSVDGLCEDCYAAVSQQPAPVVPQDVLDALQKVARIRLDMNDFDGDLRGIADCLCDAEEALIEVVNRCAAMLAAAPQSPGSEPATVPGKWIPVSERMPIEFEAVIAFDGDQVYGEAMYSSDDGFTIDGYEPCDRLNLQNVTHWMSLPAAPQEVSDA